MYIQYFYPSVNYDIPMQTSLLQLKERVIKIFTIRGILFTSTIIKYNYYPLTKRFHIVYKILFFIFFISMGIIYLLYKKSSTRLQMFYNVKAVLRWLIL